MPHRERKYFRGTLAALQVLGHEIKEARIRRGYSETTLANRVGCSRDTIRAIESGRPTVEAGLIFEAAARAGIAIFGNHDEYETRKKNIRTALNRH